jgi:hypothetical protein
MPRFAVAHKANFKLSCLLKNLQDFRNFIYQVREIPSFRRPFYSNISKILEILFIKFEKIPASDVQH